MEKVLQQPRLDADAVLSAYKGWAPFYDYSFGVVAAAGRRAAVQKLNETGGHVLEVGVGTGLSLPDYKRELQVTGIDLSPEMLAKAAERVAKLGLRHVKLSEMDASDLKFEDETFDAAAVMFVMTVVPDPAAVMAELRRVLRPGGSAIIVNHFSRERGLRALAERELARFSHNLGWHPIFPISTVTKCPGFRLAERIDVWPFGLFTLLRLEKVA